ncbi:MAG: amidophosphoribosyltransferase [Actinomycetota bacterium]|nr:amidophosphoribosyltransferase [Actinomycetota bacterium]
MPPPPPQVRCDDGPREACGVFGVYAPGAAVAELTFLGLYALQHRGQESAGMAVSDGESVVVDKDMGLVSNVFNQRRLAPLTGHLAVGHTRYSTTGSSTWRNAQPVYRDVGHAEFALGHNGNLVNTDALAEEAGMLAGTVASDSDLVAELLAADIRAEGGERSDGRDLEHALGRVLPRLRGAFSLVLMDEGHLIGVRDPNGFRPLCLGRLDGNGEGAAGGGAEGAGGWVLASETPALDVVGARFERELEPGEMVVIDAAGLRSLRPFPPEGAEPSLCLFEFVYFARPDSQLRGRNVHLARQRMGELLARQAPLPPPPPGPAAEAMVMPVPESGVPAAQGFSRASGIPYGDGLVKNRYIGRTFIAPDQQRRADAVRMKLNPLHENIRGKRLVVVDDSIVRGTTQRAVVRMLRDTGAAEVHLRIMSPPYRWPCFYGMDTGSRDELLAANLGVEEIRDYLGADSIAYLSLEGLVEATATGGDGFCSACLTGEYPVEIPVAMRPRVIEGNDMPASGLDRELREPSLAAGAEA